MGISLSLSTVVRYMAWRGILGSFEGNFSKRCTLLVLAKKYRSLSLSLSVYPLFFVLSLSLYLLYLSLSLYLISLSLSSLSLSVYLSSLSSLYIHIYICPSNLLYLLHLALLRQLPLEGFFALLPRSILSLPIIIIILFFCHCHHV